MIICSSSNIDLIQGVSGYGTLADGATDWRIENTAGGVFNILNSPNLIAPNLSIIESGNVGIGTIPITGTNRLQIQGAVSISGLTTANTITASGLITANSGITVNTGSLTCANDTLSKTYTATNTTSGTNDILTMRYDTTNGLRFQQTLLAVNDVRYDVIQKTNNLDSTAMSFYKGNVGIGTNNPNAELHVTCSSTATNPDTPGTIISLYVHNPTNTASQNSVIYNRIGGTSAGKVIYAFNVLSSYGCSLVINGNDTTDRLLRFNNSSDATGTDLMVINNSNGNVSIGNTTTGTHRLNVTGSVNVSGGYLVGGVALKPATAVLADTATALATSRNIAGTGFNGTADIDIPYFNLTNKITAGTGISLTTGSASSSPTISTNLTAGTNVTFSGTAPNITINAAGGTSQWIGTGNIYYNTGNVGIGTATIQSSYKLQVQGNAWIENQLVFNNNYRSGTGNACNKISFYGGGNTPTANTNGVYGIGVEYDGLEYFSNGGHAFFTNSKGGTTLGDVRLRIGLNGNVVIGGNLNIGSLTNPSDSRIKKNIEDINDDTALNKILLIQPKIYNYIDEERNKGFGKVYGFIAQQIRDVIPEAVPIIQYVIPNIYKSCLIHNKREVYHTIPLDTPIGTDIRMKESMYKIKEIYEDYFVIDNDIDADEAFVFGYSVDDFHTLDKTYIFTLNVCATQELHRRIEAQNVVIQSHEDRIKDLETNMERLLSGTT
jgi:hypothetical protein